MSTSDDPFMANKQISFSLDGSQGLPWPIDITSTKFGAGSFYIGDWTYRPDPYATSSAPSVSSPDPLTEERLHEIIQDAIERVLYPESQGIPDGQPVAIDEWAEQNILTMQGKSLADLAEEEQEQPTPRYGIFSLSFDNAKRRGKWRQVRVGEAYGTLYPDGHVHVDTEDLPVRDFLSLGQMEDYLDGLGSHSLAWVLAHRDEVPS